MKRFFSLTGIFLCYTLFPQGKSMALSRKTSFIAKNTPRAQAKPSQAKPSQAKPSQAKPF
jgi:hypothetical protein